MSVVAGSGLTNLIVTYDEPECGGAADALVDQLQRELARVGVNASAITTKPLAITQSGSHRDALYRALQDVFAVKHQNVFVITMLKGDNRDEYRRITELCNNSKPVIQHQIVTHLGNFGDVGLIVHNLARKLVRLATKENAERR